MPQDRASEAAAGGGGDGREAGQPAAGIAEARSGDARPEEVGPRDAQGGPVRPASTALPVLNEAERLLIAAAAAGEHADLRRKTIRAAVLRDLILEAHPGWVVPHAGLRLSRAIITGCLDLEGCIIAKPVLVWHSRFEGGGDKGAIVVRDARIKRLGIHSSTVIGAIVADRVQVESGVFLGGGLVKGALQVRGADIGGALAIEGTEIGDGKAALLAAGLRLTGPLILRRAKIQGEVAIPRAQLGAGLYGEEMSLAHDGIALNAESARVAGDMLLERAVVAGAIRLANTRIGGRIAADGLAVTAVPDALLASGLNVEQGIELAGARFGGSVRLDGADIGKTVRAEGLEIEGGETAIAADVIRIGGNWDMARARLVGQVTLPGADVNGQLRLTEARIYGTDLAVRGDGARIRGGCFLSRAMIFGLVRFPAAEISNQFRLRGASIKVDRGAALFASASSFGRDVELNGGFETVGGVVLDQVKIRGLLDLTASRIVSVALAQATPQAQAARRTKQRTDHHEMLAERAISLVDATIDRLEMPEMAEQRPRGIVDLTRAHVGSFEDYSATWPPPVKSRAKSADGRDIDHLLLDGFTYEHLANPSGATGMRQRHTRHEDRVGEQRIAWLEGQQHCDVVDHFKPQAWVHLGERLAAQGYHDDARTVAVARRRRETRSHAATFGQRWQGHILDVFALYGYNPWRTVLWMAAVVAAFACVFALAAGHCRSDGCFDESVFVVSNRDAYTPEAFERRYPPFNALAYSFDVFVPFVAFGYEDHWRPNIAWQPVAELPLPDIAGPTRTTAAKGGNFALTKQPTVTLTLGGALYVLAVVEMLLGLVLTSLAVTGFTGLLRGES